MPPRPDMLRGEAQGCVHGEGMPRRVFLRVCALCSMILPVPSVPPVPAGDESPPRPQEAHPETSPGQDPEAVGCQHRDSPVGRCRRCAPRGDKPPGAKVGGAGAPRPLLGGQILPARVQRTRRRPWPRMAVPWGAGAGAPLGRLRRRVLGPAPAGTGQLSPATVSCSQQPRGPARDA